MSEPDSELLRDDAMTASTRPSSAPTFGPDRSDLRLAVWSVCGLTINLGTTIFCREALGFTPAVSFAIALVVLTISSFFALRHYVYRAAGGRAATQGMSFGLSVLVARIFEYSGFLLIEWLIDWPYWLAVIIVLGCSLLLKRLAYRAFIFRT